MKKVILLCGVIIFALGISAQTEGDATNGKPWEQIIATQAEGTIPGTEKKYTMDIKYFPYSHEAIFIYKCALDDYNEKDAVLLVRESIMLFKYENKYDYYSYVVKPNTTFDNANKTGTLTSRVSFTRYALKDDR